MSRRVARHLRLAATVLAVPVLLLLWRGLETTAPALRHAALRAEAQTLDARLAAAHDTLLAAVRTARESSASGHDRVEHDHLPGAGQPLAALLGLLRDVPGLTLIALSNAPPEPVEGTGAMALHRQRISLVMEGGFFALLAGLDALETLPWALQWEELDIDVDDDTPPRLRLVLVSLRLAEDSSDV